MKPVKRNGRRRLCGWKEAFKSRGEIFHKPGQNLEAEARKGKVPKGGDEENRKYEAVSQNLALFLLE